MEQIRIRATNVWKRNWNARTRFVVNQGGTRSSKTYSIAQVLIMKAFERSGKIFTISRKTFPSLRGTVMRDFFTILQEHGLYQEKYHNKTDNIYTLNGNLFEFVSLDQPQKIRGAKRDYLWMNETNEFTYEDFTQFNLRTSEQVFMDYNPSMTSDHWVYSHILNRTDTTFIHSTYKDAIDFLPKELVKEIELLEQSDTDYWKIYGKGERAAIRGLIYNHFKPIDAFPEGGGETIYGLDFGFNNPTALVEVLWRDTIAYVQEWLYESHLTNSELIEKLKVYIPNRNNLIYADAAEPQRIEEIRQAGFNIEGADKSVMDGINSVKRTAIYLTRLSTNFWNEINTYKWRMVQDKVLDEPVKFRDHLCDALRYAIHTHSLVSPGEYLIIRK